jgi:hypothetical protein
MMTEHEAGWIHRSLSDPVSFVADRHELVRTVSSTQYELDVASKLVSASRIPRQHSNQCFCLA